MEQDGRSYAEKSHDIAILGEERCWERCGVALWMNRR